MTTKMKARGDKASDQPRPMKNAEIQCHAAEEEKEALEVLEFLQAVDEFKRKTNKAFPTWSEILYIIKSLGYRREDR